jgi:predicted anti-sigma-YlaC factor YlaD
MTTQNYFSAFADLRIGALAVLLPLLTGCSIRQSAVDMLGDALSDGSSVYMTDDDPDLIRAALPFGLKLFESLLEVSPAHRGLLLAAAKGFTGYAYLLQDQADRMESIDLDGAWRLRARARRLYLRARDYALRGLETHSPGITAALIARTDTAVNRATADDVAFMYWAGAAWAGAAAVANNDPELLINLPVAGALMARVAELDESFDGGAAHEFLVTFEAGRPGGSVQRAREHYQRAVSLSGGQRASVHLALAESVALRQQNLTEFKNLIQAVLGVEADKFSRWRLANSIAQQRARWLHSRIHELFLETDSQEEKTK